MKAALVGVVAILGASILAGFALSPSLETDEVAPGKGAPDFSAKGTDGKAYTLKSVMAKGPAVLYFIKEGCPVNQQAAPFVARMSKSYGDKANLIGVYNGPMADAKKWAKSHNAGYPVLADPDYKIIHAYGAPFSPFMIEVTKGGKVGNLVGDGGPKNMAAANKILAASVGAKTASVDFRGAPGGGG